MVTLCTLCLGGKNSRDVLAHSGTIIGSNMNKNYAINLIKSPKKYYKEVLPLRKILSEAEWAWFLDFFWKSRRTRLRAEAAISSPGKSTAVLSNGKNSLLT